MNFEIRKISAVNAPELSALAVTIYKQYFLYLWHEGGEWYMHRCYNLQTITEELSDANNIHYIAYANEKPVGYLKIRTNEKLEGYEEKDGLEVERIYILKEGAGMGLGRELMKLSFDIARSMEKEMVFLKSMSSSIDSIGFYRSIGMEICGTLTLPFGQMKNEYRGMYILKKESLVR